VIITDATKNMSSECLSFWRYGNLMTYDWFVKMAVDYTKTVPTRELERFLHDHFQVPYFLKWKNQFPPDDLIELFYQMDIGRVTDRHLDTGCGHSYSFQMQGIKTWLFFPFSDLVVKTPEGNTYLPKPIKAVIHPGEAIVFYPGWWHETEIIQGPSLSLSIYWAHPNPEFDSTYYNEEIQATLLQVREYCYCSWKWRKGNSTWWDKIDDMHCVLDRSIFGGGAIYFFGIFDYSILTNRLGTTFKIFSITILVFLLFIFIEYKIYNSLKQLIIIYFFFMAVFTTIDIMVLWCLLGDPSMVPKDNILRIPDYISN